MRSTLDEIWIRSSVPGHVLTYEETFAWPQAEREQVFALGLIRRVEDADWVECDACGEAHAEDVIFLGEDGSYPVIFCPEVGLVRVSPERLQRREVDFGVVAKLPAVAFGLTGTPLELKPGRVWLLGNRRLAGRLAEFFLVQGADWPDGSEILSSTPRLQNSGCAFPEPAAAGTCLAGERSGALLAAGTGPAGGVRSDGQRRSKTSTARSPCGWRSRWRRRRSESGLRCWRLTVRASPAI